MDINPTTISVITIMTAVLSGIAFNLIQQSKIPIKGAGLWAGFSYLMALGVLLSMYNGGESTTILAVVTDTVIFTSLLCAYLGIRKMVGERVYPWTQIGVAWAFFVSSIYFSRIMSQDPVVAMAVYNVSIGLVALFSGYEIYKNWSWHSSGKISLFMLLLFISIFMLVRTVAFSSGEMMTGEALIQWAVSSKLFGQFTLVWFVFSVVLISVENIVEELNASSLLDPLTRLLNQKAMEETATKALSRNERLNTPVALMMIDIDFFKDMNDVYGYGQANKVLQQVSKIINEATRFEDSCSRYDGDVFVVLLEGSNAKDVVLPAQRILRALEDNDLLIDGSLIPCTVSIGVSMTLGEGDFYDMLHRSDQALQQVKTEGGNGYKISDDSSQVVMEVPVNHVSESA